MKGWRDLFHGTLLAIATGPASTTVLDWLLKVKDLEHNVSLIKITVHSQHAKNQLNL